MKYIIYKSGKEYRWRLVAANGEILASGEGYKRKKACLSAIELVKSSKEAEIIFGD